MKKKFLLTVMCLVSAMLLLTGCSKGVAFHTDLGEFHIVQTLLMNPYGTMQAKEGETLLVVRMKADAGFDESRFKSYFSAEDGSSVTVANVNGVDYNCVAVATQGKASSNSVEHTLVFQVPADTAAGTSITITAPNQQPVSVKIDK